MSNVRNITPLPHADFTPQLGNYRTLQPFRYWCQKVLPLVYDDSLSYYELLCKVVDYLNKTMEDVETLHGDVTNLHTAYEELQSYVNNYFSSLDVQEEINNKLDELVSIGYFGELFSNFFTYVTPELYGGKSDNITLNDNAFKKCAESGKKTLLTAGTYLTSEPIKNIYDIEGCGLNCRISCTNNVANIIEFDSPKQNARLINFMIEHKNLIEKNGDGIYFKNGNYSQFTIENIYINNVFNGISVNSEYDNKANLYSSVIQSIRVLHFKGSALMMNNYGSTGNLYSNIYIHNSIDVATYGIQLINEVNANLENINVEHGDYRAAIYCKNCLTTNIISLHTENANFRQSVFEIFNSVIEVLSLTMLQYKNATIITMFDGYSNIIINKIHLRGESDITVKTLSEQSFYDSECYIGTVTSYGGININNTKIGALYKREPKSFNGVVSYTKIGDKYLSFVDNIDSIPKANNIYNVVKFIASKQYNYATCIYTGDNLKTIYGECNVTKNSNIVTVNNALPVGSTYSISIGNKKYGIDNVIGNNIYLSENVEQPSGTYVIYSGEPIYKAVDYDNNVTVI